MHRKKIPCQVRQKDKRSWMKRESERGEGYGVKHRKWKVALCSRFCGCKVSKSRGFFLHFLTGMQAKISVTKANFKILYLDLY